MENNTEQTQDNVKNVYDNTLIKYYKFSKITLIIQLVSYILAFIMIVFFISVSLSYDDDLTNDPLIVLGSTLSVLWIISLIVCMIINFIWFIRTLCLKTDNDQLNKEAILWGLLCFFPLGIIATFIFFIRIKRYLPKNNK